MIYNKPNNVNKGFIQRVIYNVMGEWVYARRRNKLIFDISSCSIFAKKWAFNELDNLLYTIISSVMLAIWMLGEFVSNKTRRS